MTLFIVYLIDSTGSMFTVAVHADTADAAGPLALEQAAELVPGEYTLDHVEEYTE